MIELGNAEHCVLWIVHGVQLRVELVPYLPVLLGPDRFVRSEVGLVGFLRG
jgi:hypothetical protein